MKKCISCGKESDELNANNVCPDCIQEVEEKIDEIVTKVNDDNNHTPGETVASTPSSNFETTVKERNKLAEEGKEELTPPVEEEEEQPKGNKLLKLGLFAVGTGLIIGGVWGAYNSYKAQNPTIEPPLA